MKKKKLAIVLLMLAGNMFAQKISIKNTNNNPVAKASVIVHVKYKATGYIFNANKEKMFSFVTDTTGIVELKGEFQKENFIVQSMDFEIKHPDYYDYNNHTVDYSNDPKFGYNVYLTPRNKDINVVGMPSGNDRNELDIYTASEIAKKLHIKEEEIIKLIETCKLRGKKIGDKYFVSGSELRSYLDE